MNILLFLLFLLYQKTALLAIGWNLLQGLDDVIYPEFIEGEPVLALFRQMNKKAYC